ncbi:MAG: HEAT repeat domain-containing protein, partial [Planctomycetota bacterium]|nr:HEAT repeat domain-containing protein [Planctomycetota bacterium]
EPAELQELMNGHPQPDQWGHINGQAITLSPEIYVEFLTSLDRLSSKTPVKNRLAGHLDDSYQELLVEQDKAAVLLAMNEERSETLRVHLALDLAERNVPGWITAAVQGLRAESWHRQALAHRQNTAAGEDFRAILSEVKQLPSALLCEFATALVADRQVPTALVEALLTFAKFAGPSKPAFAAAIRERWFESRHDSPEDHLDGESSSLLRTLVYTMGEDAQLYDEDFLMRVLEDEIYGEVAIQTLERKRSPRLLPVLERRLREKPFTAVAARAAQALMRWPTEQHTELLLFAYDNLSDTGVRADILSRLDNARARAEILDYWRHRKALADSKEQAVAELLALLEDESSAVRIQAIRGLATFDAVSAIPRLIPLLKSEERGVAPAAAEALEVLNRPRTVESEDK